jgi:hypothetical protein
VKYRGEPLGHLFKCKTSEKVWMSGSTAISRIGEATGGSFCCGLTDLLHVITHFVPNKPDITFAQLASGCVDFSPCSYLPLRASQSTRYCLTLLTVLVDPALALRVDAGQAVPKYDIVIRVISSQCI